MGIGRRKVDHFVGVNSMVSDGVMSVVDAAILRTDCEKTEEGRQ